MINRWEKYKNNYIELYGEHDYEYHHKFPNYDYSYLNLSDEDEEEINDDCEISDVIFEEFKDDFY
jgi:hypothetical protein